MPRAKKPSQPELHISFPEDEHGVRGNAYATEFIAIYKDQFGTIMVFAHGADDGMLSVLDERALMERYTPLDS